MTSTGPDTGEPATDRAATDRAATDRAATDRAETVRAGAVRAGVGSARGRGLGAADMVRTLLLLMALVVLFVWLLQPRGQRVHTADPSDDIAAARQVAKYHVLVPEGLAPGWRPNHSILTTSDGISSDSPSDDNAANGGGAGRTTLELGYVTPEDAYARLVESDRDTASLLRDTLDGTTPDGTVAISGANWTRYRTDRGETAIVRTTRDGATLLITGSAGATEMSTLAQALR